ncbi:MAG TPA: glycoside hydrolase family 31 protein [Bacteroidota bacterium]|nr:glycoside hydrolase family 31 protein [Bacteroidota bacterium]
MRKYIFVLLFFTVGSLGAQTRFGMYRSYSISGKALIVKTDSSSIRLIFYQPNILRADFLPFPNSKIDSSFVVIRDTSATIPYSVSDLGPSLIVSSSALTIVFQKFPLRFSIIDSAGKVVLSEPRLGSFSAFGDRRTVSFTIDPGDHFYGTGERGTALDKRGQAFDSYNTQVGGYRSPLPTMNLNVPFVASTDGYALYIDNTYKGRFDIGATDSSVFSYTAEGGELSCYFIIAPTIPAQLFAYTWLTGREPLPPRWAFGFIQSKNRYRDEAEARAVVDTMREKKIPCDALVLDLAWFKNMGDLRWNDTLWPNHEKLVSDLLAKGIKTILITEPYIVEPSINFHEGASLGYFAKDSSGNPFLLGRWWSCGGCDAALLDITNPSARTWWWSKHPTFLGSNVAGLWTDLGEPERHPDSMDHFLGGAGKVHNIFNLLWAQTIFEGFARLRPGDRMFNLTRSGFAGIQRYGVIVWSGDVGRDFGGLAVQPPMLLNMGMSGIAYHNSDIGGYARMRTTPELYVRWMQYGTFCPITRAHGAGENEGGFPTEPWGFGLDVETICRKFIELRYRLLPYIYTLAHENYETGIPLARPLFWTDTSNDSLFDRSSEYYWGDAFIVSPVVKAGQTEKNVFLPKGNWFDFWTDEILTGGKSYSVETPLDKMPIFVKAGSIIPMAPVMNYSDERPLDTLTLRCYPDSSEETSYTLYEDDGKTTAYQKGSYALTTFSQSCNREVGVEMINFTISPSRGSFEGKVAHRVYLAEFHHVSSHPSKVSVNGKVLNPFRENRSVHKSKSGSYYALDSSTLVIPIACNADSAYHIAIRYSHSQRGVN